MGMGVSRQQISDSSTRLLRGADLFVDSMVRLLRGLQVDILEQFMPILLRPRPYLHAEALRGVQAKEHLQEKGSLTPTHDNISPAILSKP